MDCINFLGNQKQIYKNISPPRMYKLATSNFQERLVKQLKKFNVLDFKILIKQWYIIKSCITF